MIYKKSRYLLIILVGVVFLFPMALSAKEGGNGKKNIAKTSGAQVGTARIDINQINALESNQGFSDYNPNSNLEGAEYPKGSGKNFMFTCGFIWGGIVNGDLTQPRVGGTTYNTGLEPGPIINGAAAPGPDTDPRWSIFRVRPDVYPGGPAVDLSGDAIWEGNSAAAIRAQYESDWTNWPAAGTANNLGAPFTDVNGDGKYEPNIDIPGVPGADQTTYYVANDLDPSLTAGLYGTQPMGVELHVTFWAYAQQGALGNMYFKKWELINKGSNTIDSTFVSFWNDVDLGYAGDDLVGCDTTLSMQFVYNGEATDQVYAPLPPPADGFTFFQGPIIPGQATDSAISIGQPFAFHYTHGVKNLPMTAAYFFVNGDAHFGDPPLGQPSGSTQFYNFMNGNYGLTNQPFIDNRGNPTKYAFYGDPTTGTGWLDGVALPPGDRREGMASGPFTFAPGDTQQVVVAEMVAGAIPGVDRLSAISLVKFYDQTAQTAYNDFFVLPNPPPPPKVSVAQLPNQIVLDWGEDQNAVAATESYASKGYNFEGYNVYQLPYASASISQGTRLATYDIVDGVGKIFDLYFDATSGAVLTHVSEFGNDTGIKRSFVVSTDAFSSGKQLINGIPYYFAVTAYGYNSSSVPHALENPIKIITVIPQSFAPGTKYGAQPGDTVKSVTHVGFSDGVVTPLVINPAKLTGDQYKVNFDSTGTIWSLTDVTKNTVVLSHQTDVSGDDAYATVDGLEVKVTGPSSPGMKDWAIPQGSRRFTWAGNAGAFGFEGFNGAIGWGSPDNVFNGDPQTVSAGNLHNTLLTLAQVTDTTSFNPNFPAASDVNLSFGYRYLRGAGKAVADPRFASHIINTTGGIYPFQDFAQTVPLSAWNVDDPAHPQRLVVGYLENNAVNGLVDGKYWPPDYSQYDNTASTGPREWLWVFNAPYSTTVNAAFAEDALSSTNPIPVMWFCTVARRGPVPFSPGGTGQDEFLIIANHVNTINDVFTFTAPSAASYSQAVAKTDVNSINVFPNPYYGVNSQETSKYVRFVTFNHLPATATIHIFNLAGIMVRTINHTDGTQFQQWDLNNDSGLPVASGLYIAYVDMPALGTTKILKMAIIQEQQYPDHF